MQGKDYEFLGREHPELYEQYSNAPAEFTIPEGDSFREFQTRVLSILEEVEKMDDSESMLIVCHGITKLVLVNELKGIPLERIWDTEVAGNTALTVFERTSEGVILQFENDQSHLG